MARKALLSRPIDCFYFTYFIIHTLITAFVDSATIIPNEYLLDVQSTLLELHIEMNNDPLVRNPPAWFVIFVIIEIAFQLPFFVVAAIAFYKDSKQIYVLTLIYAVNASLTTLACIIEFMYGFQNLSADEFSDEDRTNLVWVYLPTFVIPLFMMYDMTRRVAVLVASSAATERIKKSQ
ncbi:transmembrane protein 6/97 [Kockiozyma suomiensis]|uniref:transmembrane protein 6/97 n=1 Tax=Kockiozyma suomiensis TaxID=1337062 RepID=UPI0033438223